MNKIILKDVTFIIPLRMDSLIRLENLLMVLKFLNKNFVTNIYVLEADSHNNKITERMLPRNVSYEFVEDIDPIFHRTHYINYMVNKINTKIVAVWDADVIVLPCQIVETIEILRKGKADFSFPYDGRFLNTGNIFRQHFMKISNIKFLHEHIDMMNIMYGNKCVGGAYFILLEKYKQIGLENEDFYGWGYEDFERVMRMTNYGLIGHRCMSGPLFHLSHPRNINGTCSGYFQRMRSNFIADYAINRTPENIKDSTEKAID